MSNDPNREKNHVLYIMPEKNKEAPKDKNDQDKDENKLNFKR